MRTQPAGIAADVWGKLASPARYRLAAHIDRAEALRYLGYRGQAVDDELAAHIEDIFARAESEFEPRGASDVFAIDVAACDASGAPCIRLADTTVELTGRSIWRHLKDADAAAVIAVTLGMGSERALRRCSHTHPADAAILDAGLSAMAEAAIGAVDTALRGEAAACGLSANHRFSCGYGDCPLDAQQDLLDALDARRVLGITLTPSNLMLPSKSITAVFGLFSGANGPVPASDAIRSCRGCRVADGCAFRARGTTCWS